MPAIATKTNKGYKLTVNGISVNFHYASSVVSYAKSLKLNLIWEV